MMLFTVKAFHRSEMVTDANSMPVADCLISASAAKVWTRRQGPYLLRRVPMMSSPALVMILALYERAP